MAEPMLETIVLPELPRWVIRHRYPPNMTRALCGSAEPEQPKPEHGYWSSCAECFLIAKGFRDG